MSRYLDTVDKPAQVKKLSLDQLGRLADEIRQELILGLSKHGGHLGPNLGVVELSIALHYVFNTPKDKFIWDVSHQIYVHKLLTGRRDRFRTIRSTGGLSGFALRTESEHDSYGAAHAGTALSAALGICAARDQRGSDEHVVAIFGDAALTNGISFEGLNNVAHTTKRFIGILNDNEWSIAKNVGAISGYLNKLITNPRYNQLAKDFESFVRRLPKGDLAMKLAHRAEGGFKGAITNVGLQPVLRPDGDGRDGRRRHPARPDVADRRPHDRPGADRRLRRPRSAHRRVNAHAARYPPTAGQGFIGQVLGQAEWRPLQPEFQPLVLQQGYLRQARDRRAEDHEAGLVDRACRLLAGLTPHGEDRVGR